MIFDFLSKREKKGAHSRQDTSHVQDSFSIKKKWSDSLHSFSVFFGTHRWSILLLILAFSLLFIIFEQIGFLLLLSVLAVISRLYERYLRLEWGIELVTMAVVLTTIYYQPLLGAFIGIVTLTISVILNHPIEDPRYLPTSYLGLFIGAYVVNLFSSSSLLTAGMVGTVTYNLVIGSLSILLGARLYKIALFSLTNISFNYLAFSTLAPVLVQIVA